MSQHYANPSDSSDPHRLPDISIQHIESPMADELRAVYKAAKRACAARVGGLIPEAISIEAHVTRLIRDLTNEGLDDEASTMEQAAQEGDDMPEVPTGFYYAACFPGCMPDSEWSGPYATEAEALDAARDAFGEE